MKLALSRKNLWEKAPPQVRRAVGEVVGRVPLRYLVGRRFRETLKFLDEAEWWRHERSRDFQLSELRRICSIAADSSPYYRRVFAEQGFSLGDLRRPEDVRGLPTIDKSIVNDNVDDMLTTGKDSIKVDYITTGGTSGKPLRFYVGAARSALEYAYLVSGWKRAGYRLGTPFAVLRGRALSKSALGFHYEYDPIFRFHYYSTFHMDDDTMRAYVEHIRGLGPCFLHAYPSSAAILARFIRRTGIEPPRNVIGVLAESEIVYPEQREATKAALGANYFSSYGQTEKLVAAPECETSPHYHVWPTYGYCELLDDAGRPITTPGERGEIVSTGFINDVVPFIRYRTGDYATYVGDRCTACGREQMILADIRGHRVQENLVASDRTLIPWAAVNVHDDTFDRVHQFQFYQESPGTAVLRVVPANGFDENDRDHIVRNLGNKFDGRLTFDIEVVASIPLSGRGKAVFVDQRTPGIETHGVY